MKIVKKLLIGCLFSSFILLYAKENITIQNIEILRANDAGTSVRLPAPVYDSNRVWTGSTSNLTRKVAYGKYFKGSTDDTLRIITVQSGGTRFLVMATDMMGTGFVKNGFRIETPYSFTSGSTTYGVAVGMWMEMNIPILLRAILPHLIDLSGLNGMDQTGQTAIHFR